MDNTTTSFAGNAADVLRERLLLASILQGGTADLPSNLRRVLDFAPDGFDDPNLGQIAAAIREAVNNGNTPDLVAVGKRLSGAHVVLLSNVANDNNAPPLGIAEIEAGTLAELLQNKRVVLKLGQAYDEARQHPLRAVSIAVNAAAALEALIFEKMARPVVEFFTPSQLSAFAPPEGFNLVGDYHIQRGAPFVIGGPPGVGKSRGAVALAVAGAIGGGNWFGSKVHRQFKTMILQAENGRVRLKNEFGELDCAALDKFVRVCSPPPFGFAFERDAFCSQVRREVEKFQPDVFILDPWNRLARDDKAKDYSQAFEDLLSILPTGDAAPALGIVAHTRKPRADERASGRALLNVLAGSYIIGSVPRTVWVMLAASDDPTDKRVVWTCCKNNDGELGPRSAWERRNGLFVPVENFDWKTFDGDGDKRRVIGIEDMEALFNGGVCKLARTRAVEELMEQTHLGKTACYEALKPGGKFSEHIKEQDGLLVFFP
jgi:hypothetical protein